MAGERVPCHESEPHAGYFKTRLVYRGAWFAARIWIERETDEDGQLTGDERFLCEIDGEPRDAYEQWQWLAKHPISYTEWRELRAQLRDNYAV